MQLTPVKVTTLLHIYAIAEPLRDTPAIKAALGLFRREKLIEPEALDRGRGSGRQLTARGEAFVCDILNTPLPEA